MSRTAPAAFLYLDLAEAAEVAGMGKKEFDTLVRRGLGPTKVRLSNWGSTLFRDDQFRVVREPGSSILYNRVGFTPEGRVYLLKLVQVLDEAAARVEAEASKPQSVLPVCPIEAVRTTTTLEYIGAPSRTALAYSSRDWATRLPDRASLDRREAPLILLTVSYQQIFCGEATQDPERTVPPRRQGSDVSPYRIHLMNSIGYHVRSLDGTYANDDEASAHAQTAVLEGGHAHVWAGSRFVSRLLSPAKAEALVMARAASAWRQLHLALGLLRKGTRPTEIARQLGLSEEGIFRLAAEETGYRIRLARTR